MVNRAGRGRSVILREFQLPRLTGPHARTVFTSAFAPAFTSVLTSAFRTGVGSAIGRPDAPPAAPGPGHTTAAQVAANAFGAADAAPVA
ncbi:hypothetical protein [Streptomyces sp. H27-D2]|uniref:hypothetical protein n=1 Tax=Streptomyces sp. H27-D2 TaxID=3046304 RepID=UPI002DB5C70B|nr:hypothetical protein [Streptomyces sp. H27-D2]MEC4017973.1 hypothetical protein [Streptomyces sp. H27-D2]